MTILGICGSLGRTSANGALLRAARARSPEGVQVVIDQLLAQLPYFNADLESENTPVIATRWRHAVRSADAVLFATPEYAYEMPGVLKNGLDWIVGSGELTNKPVAVMSASPSLTGGVRAQIALVQTLGVLGALVIDSVVVPSVRQKLDERGELADLLTLARIEATVEALAAANGGDD
ncbi:MAG TPA: NADPH-dependent FMN reductase [Candidatus Acidoferrum sp.]|jgi:NAD(P)H-dependent FMN reductase|nr:NADPH-dependent FMN reductase [Candidatus Acidoferrum sp.]